MSKFNVGDRPWLTHVGTEQVTKPCPVCATTKQVTLILGTGEQVILPCEYCGKGYEAPTGYKSEYEFSSRAEQSRIIEIRITQTDDVSTTEYLFFGHRLAKEAECFSTQDEALVECEKLCAKLHEEEMTKAVHIKKNQAKNYSWNAGYHLREAKREEESAASHRARAILCKAKAKEER